MRPSLLSFRPACCSDLSILRAAAAHTFSCIFFVGFGALSPSSQILWNLIRYFYSFACVNMSKIFYLTHSP